MLTDDELDILRLMSHGWSVDRIARELELSDRTVRRRLRALCDRLGVGTPIEAVVWAVREGHV